MLGNSTLEDTKKDRTGMDTNIKIHNLEDHYLEETHPRNDTTQQDIMWTGRQTIILIGHSFKNIYNIFFLSLPMVSQNMKRPK